MTSVPWRKAAKETILSWHSTSSLNECSPPSQRGCAWRDVGPSFNVETVSGRRNNLVCPILSLLSRIRSPRSCGFSPYTVPIGLRMVCSCTTTFEIEGFSERLEKRGECEQRTKRCIVLHRYSGAIPGGRSSLTKSLQYWSMYGSIDSHNSLSVDTSVICTKSLFAFRLSDQIEWRWSIAVGKVCTYPA